jgi:hypothetical protein
LTTDEASSAWYAGKKDYNFASGRAKSDTTNSKNSAYQFT